MVDWKKDIKLSDLKPKRSAKQAPPAEAETEVTAAAEQAPKRVPKPKRQGSFLKADISFKRTKAKRPLDEVDEPKEKKEKRGARRQAGQKRAKRVVGLKIGASQIAAARVVNNGSPELVQVARESSTTA